MLCLNVHIKGLVCRAADTGGAEKLEDVSDDRSSAGGIVIPGGDPSSGTSG